MQHSVSIRNIASRTGGFEVQVGNSGASRVDDFRHVLPLWPHELADRSIDGRRKLIAVIDRALRQERRRGRVGDAAYDLVRHAILSRLLKDEHAKLSALLVRERYRGRGQRRVHD